MPLGVAIVSALVDMALLMIFGAPREMLALVVAMAVRLGISTFVTLFWKISIHAAVVAGTVTILVFVFGASCLLLAPLIPLVAWARVEVKGHSPTQAIVGAALGVLVAAVVFTVLR